MVNVNPNRESCMEYMKELIRKGLSRTEIVEECRKKIDNVHPNTFYDWYDIVIVESDIEEWEKENKIKIHDKRQDKIDLKHKIYIDQKKIYKTSTDKDEKKESVIYVNL